MISEFLNNNFEFNNHDSIFGKFNLIKYNICIFETVNEFFGEKKNAFNNNFLDKSKLILKELNEEIITKFNFNDQEIVFKRLIKLLIKIEKLNHYFEYVENNQFLKITSQITLDIKNQILIYLENTFHQICSKFLNNESDKSESLMRSVFLFKENHYCVSETEKSRKFKIEMNKIKDCSIYFSESEMTEIPILKSIFETNFILDENQKTIKKINQVLIFCSQIRRNFSQNEINDFKGFEELENFLFENIHKDKKLEFVSEIEMSKFCNNISVIYNSLKTEFDAFKIKQKEFEKFLSFLSSLSLEEFLNFIKEICTFYKNSKYSKIKTELKNLIKDMLMIKLEDFAKTLQNSENIFNVELFVDFLEGKLKPIKEFDEIENNELKIQVDKLKKSNFFGELGFESDLEARIDLLVNHFKILLNTSFELKIKELNKKSNPLNLSIQQLTSSKIFLKNFISHTLKNESPCDYQIFNDQLKDFIESKENIIEFNETVLFEKIRFLLDRPKRELLREFKTTFEDFISTIQSKCLKDWLNVLSFIKIEKKKLIEETLTDQDDPFSTSFSLETFCALENKVENFEKIIDEIQRTLEFLKLHFDLKEVGNENLNLKKWQDFKFLFEKKRFFVNEKSRKIQINFKLKFEEISVTFEEIYSSVSTFRKNPNLLSSIAENLNYVVCLFKKWNDFENKNKGLISYINQFEELFEEIFKKTNEIRMFFSEEVKEWKKYFELDIHLSNFTSMIWNKARLELTCFKESFKSFENIEIDNVFVKNKVQSVIQEWKLKMEILSIITGEDFSERNWNNVKALLDYKLPFDQMTTLDVINNSQFSSLKNAFEEIRMAAKNEKIISNLLDDLIYFVHSVEFKLKSFSFNANSENFTIFTKLEILEDQLHEKISVLTSLIGNPFSDIFEDKIEMINKKIKIMDETIQLIKVTQKKWLSLYSIMTSDFVKNGKKSEYLKFILIHQKFIGLTDQCLKKQIVHFLLDDQDTIQMLNKLIESLDIIQKNLFEFLELKRIEFPRFYFLGDYDLIEFLGNYQKESSINSVISKFIPASKKIIMNLKKDKIVGLVSHLNENFQFENSVEIKQGLQNWLDFFIEEIKFSILSKFCCELTSFEFELTKIPNSYEQIVMIIFWIKFMNLLVNENDFNALKKIVQKNINFLISLKNLDNQAFNLRKSLLLDSIYQVEILDRRSKEKNFNNSYLLYSLLKYDCQYISKSDISVKNTRLYATIGSYRTQYSCEFLGNQQKLVQTPLTEKCFLIMSTSLAIGLGGNPYGPAGTGKTESIKALGMAFGRLVIVFNCDETMDFKNMSRLFIGIVGSGAWGCFDEFNRLKLKELSAISQIISQIQTVQKTKSNMKIEINGSKLSVPESVGIFITLNPLCEEYKGRNKLPKNLKVLFRSFAMTVPNSQIIVRISLICIGFEIEFANQLSMFLVDLFESTSKVLDVEKCYDWGLRGLKTLVSQIEFYINRFQKQDQKFCDNNIQLKSVKLAIETNIISKLLDCDKGIFEEILCQTFAKFSINLNENSESDREEFEMKSDIEKIMNKSGFIILNSQVNSCLQMHNILNRKIGFGITGKPSSGKSTIFEILKSFYQMKNNHKVKIHRFCPKSMEKSDLFGSYLGEENEFHEGIFVKLLRESLKDLSEDNYQFVWIIFHGIIDPNWAENLNSALDDNQLYTLANGERLSLPNNLKIIFETEHFDNASMATISRLGILNHQLKEEEYEALIDHNLSKVNHLNEVSFPQKSSLQIIFDKTGIDRLILSKNHLNSKLFITNIAGEDRQLENIMWIYYCNKKSSISDFIIFFEKVITSVGNKKTSSFEIQINDLDIVEYDEFGTRLIEEVLIQIVDFGWIHHDKKVINFDRVLIYLNVMDETRINKFSKRLLGKIRILDDILDRFFQQNLKFENNCIGMNEMEIFYLYKNKRYKESLSSSEFDILKSLCENIENINEEVLAIYNKMVSECMTQENLSYSKFLSKHSNRYIKIWNNSKFLLNRTIKLLISLNSPAIEKIIFFYLSESFAEISVQMVCNKLNFETRKVSNTCDLKKQIYETITEVLNGKKILLVFHDITPKDENISFYLDVLCNYSNFSYFIEDYKRFSGQYKDESMDLKLAELKANFKILVLWNLEKRNEFEQIQNGYSCFSRHFISVIDEKLEKKELRNIFNTFYKEISIEKDAFIDQFVNEKTTLEKLCKQLTVFQDIYTLKSNLISENNKKLEAGLEKINETEKKVDFLKSKITQEKFELSSQQEKLDEQITQISISSIEINNQKAITEKLSNNLQTEKKTLTIKKESINTQLEAVIPIVEEAKMRIKSLSKSNIDELRNYHIPPEVVLDIFGVLLRLMNESDISWNSMKKILGKRTVIEQIVEIDPRKVNSSILKEVESLILKKPDSFNKEKVAKISVAAAPIAEFVIAIIKFVRTVQNIKPLEDEFKTLSESLKISEMKLRETQENVEKIVVQQNFLKKQLCEKSLEIEQFKQKIKSKEDLFEKSIILLQNLGSEKERWKSQNEQLINNIKYLPLSSFLASFYLIYLTPEKSHVAKIMLEEMRNQIGLKEKISISKFLMQRDQLNLLLVSNHPRNRHDYLNTYCLSSLHFPSIVYDPDNKINLFLKDYFKISESFQENSLRLTLKLELSIKLGKTILINCQKIPKNDHILDCLNQWITIDRSGHKIRFADKFIDISSGFKLILLIQEYPKPNELLNKIQILNYSISKSAIKNEILSAVIDWNRPDLEKNKIMLNESKLTFEKEIYEAEQQLLQILNTSSANVLEDSSLFKTLSSLKTKSESNSKNLTELNENLRILEDQRSNFDFISHKIAIIFDCIISLQNINLKYSFSSEYLLKNFFNFIKSYKKNFDTLNFLSEFFEEIIYEVCLCLDQESKTAFLLILVNSLSLFESEFTYSNFPINFNQIVFTKIGVFDFIFQENEESSTLDSNFNIKERTSFNSMNQIILKEQSTENKIFSSNLEKMIYAKMHSKDELLDLTIDYLSLKLPKKIFEGNFNLIEWIDNNFSKIFIIYLSDEKSNLDLKDYNVADSFHIVSFLIGTISAQNLIKQLTSLIDKKIIVFLKNIHSHYESFSAILNFIETYYSKFNEEFKLVLTTEAPENLPLKIIENSSKYSICKEYSFTQNIHNSLRILNEGHKNIDSQLDKFGFFHSILLERMNFIPIGWAIDYEYSDSELNCLLELRELILRNGQKELLEELVLKILYFAKIDNQNDKKVMKILHRKSFQENLILSNESFSDSSFINLQVGLPKNSTEVSKLKKLKKVLQNIKLMRKVVHLSENSFKENQNLSCFEHFNLFWFSYKTEFLNIPSFSSDNSLIHSYIDSETNLYKKIVDKLSKLYSSLADFLNSKIKLTDVCYHKEIIIGETPNELQAIWQNKTNFIEYLAKLIEMWNQMKLNFQNLICLKFELNLKGLVCYKKLFEILKLINFQNQKGPKKESFLVIIDRPSHFCKIEGLSLQGGFLNSEWKLQVHKDNEQKEIKQILKKVPLSFIEKTEINPEEFLKVQIFNNSDRSRLIESVFVKVDLNHKELLTLSSVAFYIHD